MSSAPDSIALPGDLSKQLVLFHRDFRAFTGGHLKVWDYFNHVASSPTHEARITFSPESKWDSTNPWFNSRGYVVEWEPAKADMLFLAGTDWRALPDSKKACLPNAARSRVYVLVDKRIDHCFLGRLNNRIKERIETIVRNCFD
jgi:hypothetical protein